MRWFGGKVLAAKPDDLSSIPKTRVKERTFSAGFPLTSALTHGKYVHIHT